METLKKLWFYIASGVVIVFILLSVSGVFAKSQNLVIPTPVEVLVQESVNSSAICHYLSNGEVQAPACIVRDRTENKCYVIIPPGVSQSEKTRGINICKGIERNL